MATLTDFVRRNRNVKGCFVLLYYLVLFTIDSTLSVSLAYSSLVPFVPFVSFSFLSVVAYIDPHNLMTGYWLPYITVAWKILLSPPSRKKLIGILVSYKTVVPQVSRLSGKFLCDTTVGLQEYK